MQKQVKYISLTFFYFSPVGMAQTFILSWTRIDMLREMFYGFSTEISRGSLTIQHPRPDTQAGGGGVGGVCAAYASQLACTSIATALPSCLPPAAFRCHLYLLKPGHPLRCARQRPAPGKALLGGELCALGTQRPRAEVWVLGTPWLTEPDEATHKGKENQV